MARSMSKAKSAKMRKSHRKRHSKSHKKSLKHRKGHKTAKKHRKGRRKSKKAGRISMGNNDKFVYADTQFRRKKAALKEQEGNARAAKIRQMLADQKAQAQAQAQAQTAAPSPQSSTGQFSQSEMDMI